MADEDLPKLGDEVFSATWNDLTASCVVATFDEEGYYCQLVISDSSGPLWKSEPATDPFESTAFGSWFDGCGIPEWFGDLDNDGKPELLAPVPKGDLSPTIYRTFRWTGGEMLFLRKRALLEDEQVEESFVWGQISDEYTDGVWIEHFNDGRGEVVSMLEGVVRSKKIRLKPSANGFKRTED